MLHAPYWTGWRSYVCAFLHSTGVQFRMSNEFYIFQFTHELTIKMVWMGNPSTMRKNIWIFCCSRPKCENAKLPPFILVETHFVLCIMKKAKFIEFIRFVDMWKWWMRVQRSPSAFLNKRIWIAMAGFKKGACNRRLTNMHFNVMHTLYCVSSHTNQFPSANVIN